jgi:galactofuranosylgalactofuranosylrhamnosyl-N-acetylglucosaminyl-diphospho-decaprenol beta-1,5/1,6-galactofuranosyltransferase
MHIVSRIKLPLSADVSSLYFQCNEGASIKYHEIDKEIGLRQGGMISSNSYFNSFYEKFYTKYTNLESIYYLLKVEGDFQVSVYREIYQGNNRELIHQENFEQCQPSEPVKVLLPNLLPTETAGRIYFELTCLSEQGLFKQGLIATEQPKNREVSLGIITCTFKKEAYIKPTVKTILQDDLLQSKEFKIFVVDNGRTLTADDFPEQIQLISNKNVGGSGGFTRGLIEGLLNTYSHFLLMDDDIELESESIYRLFSLYEYAKFDFAVSGSMLDLYKKHVLYEAGALYGISDSNMESAPFSTAPLKHNLELQNTNALNFLLVEDDIDYGGFWFFSISKELIEKIGLPMPFFIKVDDMEFGLRIKERFGNKIVAFPSIAVWHEPFYAKYPIWDIYYMERNHLITEAIHGSLTYKQAIKHTTESLILYLSVFDYNSAKMLIKAFEDYIKGPNLIKNNQPEVLHSNILKLSKSYESQKIQQNYSPPYQFEQKSRAGSLKKLVSLLTFNGHLLPNFLTSDDEVFIWHGSGNPGQRSQAFAKKRVLLFKEESGYLFQNEIDKLAGIKILTQWVKVAVEIRFKWSYLNAEWKKASKELSSINFWQQYLGLSAIEHQD